MNEVYEFVFHLAGYFCHQLPERSFFIGGAQFPICIRCASLLAGGLGAFAYLVARFPVPHLRLCFLMALPMMVDVSLTLMEITEGNNHGRAATALLFGFFFLMGSLQWLAGYRPNWEQSVGRSKLVGGGALKQTVRTR